MGPIWHTYQNGTHAPLVPARSSAGSRPRACSAPARSSRLQATNWWSFPSVRAYILESPRVRAQCPFHHLGFLHIAPDTCNLQLLNHAGTPEGGRQFCSTLPFPPELLLLDPDYKLYGHLKCYEGFKAMFSPQTWDVSEKEHVVVGRALTEQSHAAALRVGGRAQARDMMRERWTGRSTTGDGEGMKGYGETGRHQACPCGRARTRLTALCRLQAPKTDSRLPCSGPMQAMKAREWNEFKALLNKYKMIAPKVRCCTPAEDAAGLGSFGQRQGMYATPQAGPFNRVTAARLSRDHPLFTGVACARRPYPLCVLYAPAALGPVQSVDTTAVMGGVFVLDNGKVGSEPHTRVE